MLSSIVYILLSYLVGCFPTGKLVAKAHNVEIEKLGSGNVGATNIARTIGKKAGIITLAVDAIKGLIVVVIARKLELEPLNGITNLSLAAVAVVLGHCFSLPGLKGGKGVATALGVLSGLAFPTAIAALLLFAGVFYVSKYVSAGSLAASLGTPLVALLLYPDYDFSLAIAVIGLILTYRHKDNIQRLIEGRENPFKF